VKCNYNLKELFSI